MPKYSYYCDSCKGRYTDWHGMKESSQKCKSCDATPEYLTRVPSLISDGKVTEVPGKVGSVVTSHIEETKEALRKEKKELKKEIDI